MANVDLAADVLNYEFDSTTNPYFRSQAWPIAMNQIGTMASGPRRNISPIQTTNHGLRQTTMAEHPMMDDWRFQQMQLQQQQQQSQSQHQHQHHYQHRSHHASHSNQQISYEQQSHALDANFGAYDAMAVSTQMAMIAVTQAPLSVPISLGQSYAPLQAHNDSMPYSSEDFHHELIRYITTDHGPMGVSPYQQTTSSPTGSHLEVLSQPSDDLSWPSVEANYPESHVYTYDSVDPIQTLHDRPLSESSYSDLDQSVQTTFLNNLELGPMHAAYSPTIHSVSDSEFEYLQICHSHDTHSAENGSSMAVGSGSHTQSVPVPSSKGSSPVRSPGCQTPNGSPGRKVVKKSPIVAAKGTERVTKKSATNGKADEKRVGRRKGPLKPEQRKQAHEIRKRRACLRCKFLKKTCDTGEPCGGCQPSHARLWQVPCTRIDIKEIGYFLKDKKFDYERHVSLGTSVANLRGFSDVERKLYITHGYGHVLPIKAREIYVRDDKCLRMDWVEAKGSPAGYEVSTARLTAGVEGISMTMLSEYLDKHIDGDDTFVNFVDQYFQGTKFLAGMLKAAYRYYFRTQSKIIKKALRLILAYSLTLHITMVEGLPVEEALPGRIDDKFSKFYGKTIAPVMINFEIKVAMANMWREIHKDVLEELSSLYSGVYSGDKLKNWPTIFMLASVLLAVWELMQFDCHYRVPDEAVVDKFCTDMETTPVGVIVGLFSAISQKVPSILEWNTAQHGTILNSNKEICDAMTDIREHVTIHESYLRDRPNAKFDSKDFDSLSNKFLSRLVLRDIRAN